ncbi:hypothetical protein [Microbacterium arborescens]|uniref:hypothetical protein n=1 Tax=Microbacterium arborescens TaxID=33883 RepID=UPI000DF734D8|nr:hypothetical protein [Microbacterium arborescens]
MSDITTDTVDVDVIVEAPEPVTAASAVVGYPHVMPAAEYRANLAFRTAGIVLIVLGLTNAGWLAWAITTGAL